MWHERQRMYKKRTAISLCMWMVLVGVVVDCALAQTKMPEISGLTAKGQRSMPEIPDFTRGGKKNNRYDWNLGPTGARGWMCGMRLRTDYARQILITKADPGSPSDGILQVDDVILGINGKEFDSDARIAFGKAITEAEKAENRGLLKLIRWRQGKTENVTLRLKVMGTYGPMAPMNCRKSQSILDDACRYIEKNGIGRGITGHVKALAKKPGDFIGGLKKIPASKDRDTILGGIYGLEYQRKKAEPAIDALVGLLRHEDGWIRFRAGCALCGIGKAAKYKAVPIMLKMATRTFPDDPREMNHRYISYVLWGDGYNGSPHGLLADSMDEVDQTLLVAAIKKLIRNDDGQIRYFVSRAIRMMSFEELAPLWPALIYGLKNPAPSGIMFNEVVFGTHTGNYNGGPGIANHCPARTIRTERFRYIIGLSPETIFNTHITASKTGVHYLPHWNSWVQKS